MSRREGLWRLSISAEMPKIETECRIAFAEFSGSPEERAEAYGEMFKDRIKESGIVDFYHDYIQKHFYNQSAFFRSTLRFLQSLVASRHSKETHAAVKGFCRGTGYKEGKISRGLAMPDVLNYLGGLSGNLPALPSFGCTSVAVWDSYTRNGSLVYGRNLDFPGNGYFDRFPLVTRIRPRKGIPYVSIGAAGTFVDGITGINEEGLTVALHQHLSKDVSILKKGRPMIDLAARVLQNARGIDQAVEICRDWIPTSAWTIVLTHWKERRAAVLERTPSTLSTSVFKGGVMVRTNDFLDPALKKDEIDFRPFRESSRLRAARAAAIVDKAVGRMDAAAMAGLLSDHADAERGMIRAFGQTISQPHNMTSVVFEPEEGVMWVAEGRAPASHGPYRKFHLWEGSFGNECLPRTKDPLSAKQWEAYRTYMHAAMIWQRSHDHRRVFELLSEVVKRDPNDSIYRYMHGLYALKSKKFKEAAVDFAKGSSMPDLAHRAQAQRLWQARALDLLGRRSAALKIYKEVSHHRKIARTLRRAAVHGILVPYTHRKLDGLIPDFILGDVFQY